jgi:hypothetical protein
LVGKGNEQRCPGIEKENPKGSLVPFYPVTFQDGFDIRSLEIDLPAKLGEWQNALVTITLESSGADIQQLHDIVAIQPIPTVTFFSGCS